MEIRYCFYKDQENWGQVAFLYVTLGSAYRDGLRLAKGEFIILMDADLSHHPKYIIDFVKK